MDNHPPISAQDRHRLMAADWFNFAVAVVAMLIGLLAFSFIPVWLAPPYLEYTFPVYCLLSFAWLPILLGLMVISRHRNVFLRAYAVLAVLLFVFWGAGCFIGSIVSGNQSGIALTVLLDSNLSLTEGGEVILTCTSEVLDNGHTRYNCTGLGFLDSCPCYVFEGRTGSPFVRLAKAGSLGMRGSWSCE